MGKQKQITHAVFVFVSLYLLIPAHFSRAESATGKLAKSCISTLAVPLSDFASYCVNAQFLQAQHQVDRCRNLSAELIRKNFECQHMKCKTEDFYDLTKCFDTQRKLRESVVDEYQAVQGKIAAAQKLLDDSSSKKPKATSAPATAPVAAAGNDDDDLAPLAPNKPKKAPVRKPAANLKNTKNNEKSPKDLVEQVFRDPEVRESLDKVQQKDSTTNQATRQAASQIKASPPELTSLEKDATKKPIVVPEPLPLAEAPPNPRIKEIVEEIETLEDFNKLNSNMGGSEDTRKKITELEAEKSRLQNTSRGNTDSPAPVEAKPKDTTDMELEPNADPNAKAPARVTTNSAKTSPAPSSASSSESNTTDDEECQASARRLGKDRTLCSTTKAVISGAQQASQLTTMIGSMTTAAAGGVAVGSAQSGKMADTYNKAGDAALAAAWSNWGVAAVNGTMIGVLHGRARGHAEGKAEAEEKAAGLDTAIATETDTNKKAALEQEKDDYMKARGEQQKVEELANSSTMQHYVGMARSVFEGARQYATAQANYASGCVKGVGASCDETPFGGNGPTRDGGDQTDLTLTPPVIGNDENASADDTTGTYGPDSLGNPNNPGLGGGPPIVGPLPPGGGGGGGAPGGGAGGGALGGGGTSVAKEDTDPAANQGFNGKQPFYAGSGSSGYAGGGAKGSAGGGGKGVGGDLAAMLAAAFGKKGEEKDPSKSILDFDAAKNRDEGSLLSKETNIFARMHDTYQEQQKINAFGLPFTGRALASEPPLKRGR